MSNELPPETTELVRIVAAVDSLFSVWPDPHKNNPACVEVGTRQRDYLAGRGLPWRVGGDVADRKTGERILTDLETDGLIVTRRAVGAHRHVGLTDAGDDMARSLLGFYRLTDCWNVFRGLASAVERGPGRWAGPMHVAEALGESDERIGWALLYPLLARGYVEAAVSSVAETIFTVRAEQRKMAGGPPPKLAADPDADPRCNPIFWSAYDAAEAEKLGWKPRRPNCCCVPILN